MPETTPIDGVTLRILQRKVDEARYLTADNAHRYRPIMRLFYTRHMAHQYTLRMDDIFNHVRSHVEPAYTQEACEQDLRQLTEWGNLVSEQDRSRARTVEEFLRRHLNYQISPYGIAFERLLEELEQDTGTGGSLDVSLLERLLARLSDLAKLYQDHTIPLAPPAAAQAYALWNEAFEAFDQSGERASDYLAALHRSRQEDLTDVEAFLAYKDVLVQYLNTFVTGLLDHGERIQALLTRWIRLGTDVKLIDSLVDYQTKHVPNSDGRLPTTDEVRQARFREWQALFAWFQTRGGLETLRRRTITTVERVVRQSHRVMDRRAGLSRKRDLESLALAFMRCAGQDEAHRLAGAALACAAPKHLLGSAEVFRIESPGTMWEITPQDVDLRPIYGRGQIQRGQSDPVPEHESAQQQVLWDEIGRRRREGQVWDELFQNGEVNLGRLHITDPAIRAPLLQVLARCLAASDWTTLAPDGSQISLHLPHGADTGQFTGPDGVLALPQFVLKRRRDAWAPDQAAAGSDT